MSEQEKPEEREAPRAESETEAKAATEIEAQAAAKAGAPEGAEADASAETEGDCEVDELEHRVAELEAEIASLNDKLLRAAADVQNIHKRAERDRRDAETYGGRKLARDLLQVYDNLDATLKHASDELKEKEPTFFNGVELTRKELLNAFAKHRIEALEPEAGERFDPNLHQAMFEAPAPGATPGTVIQVMQAGFKIAEQLLRPAMVGVASAASPAAPAEEAKSEAETESSSEEKASAN